jgi:hypothetical protein
MKYQLVLQFQALSVNDFDLLVALEETLRGVLEGLADVDGHDFGSGEFNIFVHTNEPEGIFGRIREVVNRLQSEHQMRAAYRDFDEQEYTILWPPDLKEFKIA